MKHTLTKYPEYKDSGLQWLGKVPKDWNIRPGLSVLRETHTKNLGLIETTVLSLSYGRVVIKPVAKLHGLVPASFETYQIVQPGDIIIRPTDLQNDWTSLRVGIARNRGIITSAYMCLTVLPPLIAEYGHLLLHSFDLMKIFYGMGSGLRQNMSFKDLKRMPALIPPAKEQEQIVRYIAYANARIERLIRAKQDLIELLNEQKRAIIQRAVTRGLDPNVRLKPSGVDWLGDVPEHWETVRIKYLLQELDERSTTGHEILLSLRMRQGLVPHDEHFKRPGQASTLVGYKLVYPGQVVMNRLQANNGLVFSSDVFGVVSPDYAVFKPIADIDTEYLTALLRTSMMKHKFRVEAKGLGTGTSGFLRLYSDRFGRIPVAIPRRTEQMEIMRFLTDALAGNLNTTKRVEAEIDLLREYRTRLITEVVTGKLDVRGVEIPSLNDIEQLETVATDNEIEGEDLDGAMASDDTEELVYADD